ncbi:hypothetical protein VAE122_3600001 [Vibrio aestuarianus]|nr:hypothetical protein VAE122_3600001 [Vibrio aestuarianus]
MVYFEFSASLHLLYQGHKREPELINPQKSEQEMRKVSY